MNDIPVSKLRNIGSTVSKRLNEIGIYSRTDLERVGAALAYAKLKRLYPESTLPRCYYLYSLEGALRDIHWDKLTKSVKTELSMEAGLKDI